jgi:hypothetical protein
VTACENLGGLSGTIAGFHPVSSVFPYYTSFHHCSIPIYHRPLRCMIALNRQHIIIFWSLSCDLHFWTGVLRRTGYRIRKSVLQDIQDVMAHRVLRRWGSHTLSTQSAHGWREVCSPTRRPLFTRPGRFLVLISVRGWVEPRAIVRLESTSSGLDPAAFRLIA